MEGFIFYRFFILGFLIAEFLLECVVDLLNVKNISLKLPTEFEGYYDSKKYSKSQEYLKEKTRFTIFHNTISLIILLVFILIGGFNYLDHFVRSFDYGSIITGLLFFGICIYMLYIVGIPFSIYGTFVIEEKYGFNKTTMKTFCLDIIKTLFLISIICPLVLIPMFYFFEIAGDYAWLYVWSIITLIQLILIFVAPVIIMPLFNKFTPLEEGNLKRAIEQYSHDQRFAMKGVFVMDGSKRSTHSNAFFAGFGKFRRICLFDTLIERHSLTELIAVLGHEVGHYKLNHIIYQIISNILQTGIILYILSFFLLNRGLFDALYMEHLSVYASLIFFSFLFSPINSVVSIAEMMVSRRFEYQADKFSVDTLGLPESLINGLKKLCVDNLSNLTPHPLKVFLQYSHPPILDRIKAIRALPNKKPNCYSFVDKLEIFDKTCSDKTDTDNIKNDDDTTKIDEDSSSTRHRTSNSNTC